MFVSGLGMLILGHFIYRFVCVFTYGSFLITNKWDMFFIALHGLLSASSMIFHIPKFRNQSAPMIYPEMRLHTIAFTFRSVICCFICFYLKDHTFALHYKIGTCILTMLSADAITYYFREPNTKSPIRYVPFREDTSVALQNYLKNWYSSSQIFATFYMLKNIDCGFVPVFPIQLAAFLMTLVRKSVIKPITWHHVYTVSLCSNILVVLSYTPYEMIHQHLLVILFRYFRFTMNCDKYIVWSIIFTIYIYTINLKFPGYEWFTDEPNFFVSTGVIMFFSCQKLIEYFWYGSMKEKSNK